MLLNPLEMVEWTHPLYRHQHKYTLFTNSSEGEKSEIYFKHLFELFFQNISCKKRGKNNSINKRMQIQIKSSFSFSFFLNFVYRMLGLFLSLYRITFIILSLYVCVCGFLSLSLSLSPRWHHLARQNTLKIIVYF